MKILLLSFLLTTFAMAQEPPNSLAERIQARLPELTEVALPFDELVQALPITGALTPSERKNLRKLSGQNFQYLARFELEFDLQQFELSGKAQAFSGGAYHSISSVDPELALKSVALLEEGSFDVLTFYLFTREYQRKIFRSQYRLHSALIRERESGRVFLAPDYEALFNHPGELPRHEVRAHWQDEVLQLEMTLPFGERSDKLRSVQTKLQLQLNETLDMALFMRPNDDPFWDHAERDAEGMALGVSFSGGTLVRR